MALVVVASAGGDDETTFPLILSNRLSKSSSSLLHLKSISKSIAHLASTAISLFISSIMYTQPQKVIKFFGPHLTQKAVGLIDNPNPKELLVGLKILEGVCSTKEGVEIVEDSGVVQLLFGLVRDI